MIYNLTPRNTFTVKTNLAHKLRDFLRRSLGKRSPDYQRVRVEGSHQYRRTDHGLESIQQWLSDRMETVLALRQVGKTIIWGINSLNSFNQFLVKQEFGSSSKRRKHYPNCAGLVQYRGIS